MSRTTNGNLAGRAAQADDLAIPFEPTDTMRWNSIHLAELHQGLGHDKFHDFYHSRCLLDSEELKDEILAEYAEAWKALDIVVTYCPPLLVGWEPPKPDDPRTGKERAMDEWEVDTRATLESVRPGL